MAGYTSGGEQQMCAIGRALMSRPKMILLDEPSMGLAPQLVEEIFEIVRDLNAKEGVSFLLAEQNTNMALRYADYGYILENGRVVMDGAAQDAARERGRQGVLPRRRRRPAARASATSSTTAGASAGWRDQSRTRRAEPLRRARDPRARTQRERDLFAAACRDLIARARDSAPRLGAAHLARRRSADGDQSARRWRSCRCCASPTCRPCRKPRRPSAASTSRAAGQAAAAVRVARPDLRAGGPRRGSGGAARALFAAGFRPGDVVHNTFAYHLTPGGFMLEVGARALGCAVIPGGIGNTEQQFEAIEHYRPSATSARRISSRSCSIPRPKTGKRRLVARSAGWSPARLAEVAARRSLAARGVERHAVLCHRRSRLDRLRDARRARAWSSTRTLIVEIVRPGTGDPVAEGEVGEVVVTSLQPATTR